MKKTEYYNKSSNIAIQPSPYFLYEIEEGSFMSDVKHVDITRNSRGEIVEDCSGNRFQIYKNNVEVSEPKETVFIHKNIIHLNLSSHYWHFHHETLGQFLIYKDLNILAENTPSNAVILVTWERKMGELCVEALKHIFNFNILDYEIIFARLGVLYKTTKILFTTTKTSTAGLLPLPYFSEKISNYLTFKESPTDFIYVSRDDSDCRLLLNQDEIIKHLNENEIPIRKVSLAGKSYTEQVNLFANSKFILVIVGSGTTNQIYCNPLKTKILFISPLNHMWHSSFSIAKSRNMEHMCLEAQETFKPSNKHRAVDPSSVDFKLKKEDVLREVKKLLHM